MIEHKNTDNLTDHFLKAVQNNPDKIAIFSSSDDTGMSYRELDERSNQLAQFFIASGIVAGSVIAVELQRSTETLCLILAIIKAGCAYAPIDVNYPQERKNYMVSAVNAAMLIKQGNTATDAPLIINIDDIFNACAHLPVGLPQSKRTSQSVAYVMFTSGSTGTPKAVQIQDEAICRLHKQNNALQILPSDKVLLHSALVFDASTYEIWATLLAGATVVVARNEPLSIRFLAEHISDFDISVLWLTAPLVPLLAEQNMALVNSLRLLVAGGDALPSDAVQRISAYCPGLHFVNGYGPTEATTFSCHFAITADCHEHNENTSIPIGYPLDGTSCYVLDEALTPVQDGELGELYIGGSGVGHGYRNDAAKTATHFIPNPFAGCGSRLYKTGDLVKRGSAGELIFFGRCDQQIKVRGYRVEPGEIDTALCNLPGVEQSVTLVIEHSGGQKQLLSFVVIAADVLVSQLKARLSGNLPDYMLPNQIVPVDVIPLNVNGKVDRKALLSALESQSQEKDENHGLEALISDLFKEVLMVKSIDPNLSFFDMGGDSISAIQISGLAEQRGIALTVSSIFELKTIRAIAGALSNVADQSVSSNHQIRDLLAVWAEVLERPDIGPDDNFFELGGDSILAIQLAGLAEQRGLSCNVADIFSYKSVSAIVASCSADTLSMPTVDMQSQALGCTEALPDGVDAMYPASQVQVGMLIQSDVGRAVATYHDILSHTIRLPFSADTFNSALEATTARHEILRTAFDLTTYAEPMQLVYQQVKLECEVLDLQHLDKNAQQQQFEHMLEDEKQLGFDWSKPGLLRAKVLLLEPESFVLTLSFHHAIMDGWSTTVLLGDFVDLYAGFVTESQLNARTVTPYRTFIEAEQKAIKDSVSRDFWDGYLQDVQQTALPKLNEVPANRGVNQCRVAITPEQTVQLKAIATRMQVSLKHVLLAVHMRAISLLSGSSKVLSGLVCHGRPEVVGADRTVGLFINTIPFRSEIQNQSWLAYIQHIFTVDTSTLPFRRYPLANILRDHGSSSLFDFAFNYTHFREYSKRFRGKEALVARGAFGSDPVFGAVDFEHSNFGLAVQAGLSADGHCAYLVLDSDKAKYSPASVSLIAQAYNTCLTHLLADPVANIADISLSSVTPMPAEYSVDASEYFDLLSRFEQITARYPQQLAVVSAEANISYAELDRRAHSVANYLSSLDVQRGEVVAVHARRGIDAIVALLAVWKVGACYLPIDPAYPDARKAYMQSDSGSRIVLFDQDDDDLSWCADGTKVQINFAMSENLQGLQHRRSIPGAAESAYLIYTSGSTGNPKGVKVAFSGLATLLTEQARLFSVDNSTPCLQFASMSFDASLFEIVMSVFNGGILHIVSEQMRLDPQLLSTYAMTHQIGVATLPASMLQTLTDYDWPADCRMIIAGEAFPAELARVWAKKAHVFNAYGPTEATIWATWHRCNEVGAVNVPIGVPIAGMEAYVLDDFGHRLPAGIAGELCLGGAALAVGYHNNPRLTAERFVPNPFSTVAGSRLYRTGDRACINAQGEIEFLGRLDWQVKLRGFRIELGEIEQAIQRLDGVINAVVILKNDNHSQRQWLVCYCQVDSHVSAELIQQQAVKYLPEYMVPGDFIVLDQFPLTVNGKIDRKALQSRKEQADSQPEQAGSEREQVLLSVWRQVFGSENIGVDDGFYSLGGDSILSIQLRALTQKEGFDFELEDLFELQTIRKLSLSLRHNQPDEEARQTKLEPFALIDDATRQNLPEQCVDAYPLSRMQAGMLFHMQYNADSVRYHDVMYYLLKGRIQPDAFKQAMALSVEQHPILRTAFDISGYSQPLQLVYAKAELAFSHEDLSHLEAEQQQEHLQQWERAELGSPFSLATPGLVRVFVHQLDSSHYRLTLSCPHAILDGWSAAMLVSQWLNSYKSLTAGRHTTVETPAIGFADFIALEQHAIESQSARDYWSSYVDGIEKCEIAHASLRNDISTTKRINLELTPNFGQAIATLAGRLQVSIKSIFLSLHLKALALLSGQKEVTTGLICHGRPEVEGSDKVLGVFLNNVPFRLNVTEQPQWDQLIQTVHHQEQLHAVHRRYPLAEIKALAGGQDLFDVAFNYTSFRPYESMSDEWLGSGGHDYSNYQFVLQAGLSAVTDEYYLFLDIDCSKVDDFYAELYRQVYLQVMENLVLSAQGAPKMLALPSALMTQLSRWQGEESEVTQDVWSLFERQAEVSAERIAVREGEFSWSYGELLARVSHWSGVLSAEGVKAGDAVGVLLERGMDAVTALLAIVRLGGRYVPLDGQYPASRLNWMLSDAGVSCVLSAGDVPSGLMAQRSLDVRTFDGLNVPLVDAARRTAVTGLYLMYTSGSTGTPKGVQVPDGAVVRLSCNRRELSIVSEDVLLLQAPLVFDASTLELWGALLNGASVAIGRPGAVSVEGLASDIRDYGVTVLWLTASLFHVVVDERLDALKGLRCLVAGGDALSGRHVSAYLDAPWSGELVNGYGPTEATTFSCVYRMEEHDARSDVPIGYPLEQSSCYVLDEQGQRVLPGVPGELYVGGAGLAHGYWGQGAKTAEAFVPNPYGAPGSRLYRTGDRVRYNRDGALEFLGRRDAQVKVRGYRIEPGEIEHALKGCEGVVHAVVWVQDEGGRKQLLAAVSGTVAPAQLTAYLQGVLPEYMQPHQLSVLADMPLTVNGKVDRAAVMRAQVLRREEGAEALSGAQSALESQLISIWQDVLQVEQIGRDESFFELGGDSILSIQLAARAASQGIAFSLEDLFEHDTVATLAAAIGAEQTQATQQSETQPFELITDAIRRQLPDTVEDAYPVSQTQLGMLYHSERERAHSAYHDILTHTVQLPFNEAALRQAWQALGARHAILRTAFDLEHYGEPLQLIYRDALPALTVDQQQGWSVTERQSSMAQWMLKEKALGFDWQRPGLLRGQVFVHKDNGFVLGLSFHHAILDGWSTSILMRDLTELYQGALAGVTIELPVMASAYRDYIALEQAALDDSETLDYWQGVLATLQPTRVLSEDKTRGEGVERAMVPVSQAETARAKALAASLGVSLKSVLLAIHFKALSSLSGESELSTGVVTNGRPESLGGESLLGLFLNSLPLSARVPSCSWSAWIKGLSKQEQALWSHRRYPMATLKREFGAELFQTLFNYTHFRAYATQAEDGESLLFGRGAEELEEAGFEHSNYGFILQAGLTPDSEQIYLMLEVDRAQYGKGDLSRAVGLYRRCLSQLLADAGGRCDEPLLDNAEAVQLSRWQGEESEVTQDVWSLFERQAEVSAERIAIREGEFSWSYGELLARVSHWSGVLSAEGVKAGDAVGVLLERGMDAVTALLAIVRLGGRYVPLDGQYPASRLNWMLSDAGVSCVLSAGDVPSGLMAQRSLDVRTFDGLNVPLVDAARRTAVTGLYLMYTSGSTGTPKGVQVPDGAVVRLSCNRRELSIVSEDVLLLQAPLVFDASTLELWGALLNGASVAIGRPGAVSVEGLASDIRDYGVTVLWLTASLFHVVVDERLDALKGLRCLVAGGDALSGRHVSAYLDAPWSGELVNGYGPTEATTFSCVYRMEEHDARSDVPIGYPLEQSSCYVLDEQGQRVLPGVPGELYVGGAGLAHGYWGQGAKTAEAFVPNPYGAPGSRLYRTGDRVRYNRDGALEFLGRRDAQVKVRGYRIEPGEIEHALKGCEGVVHAVVWVQDEGGRKQLLAAVSGTVAPAQLTAYLQGVLPEYMQPHQLSVLADMPLTVNGKVDRAAVMRAQVLRREEGAEALSGAQSALESQLISIWQDVLQVEQIGRDESFFELGGDSILSIQLAARAASQGIAFSLEDLFEHDTVATLAAAIGAEQTQATQQSETQPFELITDAIRRQLPDTVEDAYPVSQTQLGMLYHSERERAHSAYHDILTHTVQLPFNEAALRQAWQALVARHAILRTAFDLARYAEPLQLVYSDVNLSLEVEHQSGWTQAQRQDRLFHWIDREKALGFDWQRPGLLRGQVFVHKDNGFVLGLSFHHAILDGWSTSILMRDLTELYQGALAGVTIELPVMASAYRDYIALEQAALDDSETLDYWQGVLATLQPTRVLSEDKTRGEGVERAMVPVSQAETARAKALAASLGVSLKSVLLAIHFKALSSLSGESELSTGVVTNGRPESLGGESLLGLFLNSLPLSARVPSCSWSAWIKGLSKQEQALWSHRRYPMATLKREFGAELFQTLFNYTHFRAYATQAEDGESLLFGRGAEELEEAGFEHSNYGFILQAGLTPDSEQIYLMLEVDRAQYGKGDLSRAVGLYRRCLSQLLADAGGRCDEPLLDNAEAVQLSRWQGEESEVTQDVWSLFERQAEVSAERIAIREGEFSWSYGELLARVSHWSGVLSAEGVKAGDAVGVLLERGMDAVTALLAIVRLGGRYVPLDGQYPASRLNWMLSDAGVSCVLSAGDVPSGLMAQRSLDVRTFDGLNVPLVDAARRTAVTGLYLMYTSGSTGTPKGVQVPDGAVVRLSCNRRELSIVSEDVLLLQAPLVFDASTLELWGALLNGASVAIGRPGAVSVEGLASDIRDYGVTVLWLTASLFHVVVDERLDALKGLRCLVAGGDALSGRHVSAYLDAPWSGELVNGYGPTEATTFSCVYRMEEHDARSDVPIGYPLEQSSCYVLDEQGQRVLPGVPGELYVGGAGLAHGYWGQGAKTAEAFVPNPYGAPGSRLYRTGDRVRYNRDGALEFLGRRDAQVKVRGYRIEPGEIEHALKGCEGVVHAVVWVQDEGGRKQLLAAVSGTVAPAQLTAYLQGVLPEYMQPHQLSVLADMPLTVNGKVDRAAVMRAQVLRREEGAEALSGAQSALESQLISIWQDVLQVEQIGRDESFFELGGDSILSIQLAARAASQGIAFSLEDLFEHDTVATLAAALQRGEVTAVEQIETSDFDMVDSNDLALLMEEA